MAKRFGGFTPEQQQSLLSKMGYEGPAQQDDINKFMMASPKAASMMGRYTQMAKARVEGGPATAMATGGFIGIDGKTYSSARAAEEIGGGVAQYLTAATPVAQPATTAKIAPPSLTNGITQPAVTTQQPTPTTPKDTTLLPIKEPIDYTRFTTQQEAAVQEDTTPAYDPSQGLPTPVEGPSADVKNKYTSSISSWAGGLKDMITSGDIPEDLSDPVFDYAKKTVTFKDGTTVPLTMNKFDDEGPRVLEFIKQVEDYRDNVLKPYQQQQDVYNQQLGQYKDYQTGQATAATADPRATLNQAQQNAADANALLAQYTTELANMAADDPRRESLQSLIDEQQIKVTQAEANVATAKSAVAGVSIPSTTEFKAAAFEDPMSMVTKAEVAKFTPEQREAGMIAEGTGQAGAAATADTVKAAQAGDVVAPAAKAAATYDAETVAAEVQATLARLEAATGKPSAEALAEAQTMEPRQLAQLGLSAAQIEQAVQVQAPAARAIQAGEIITGPTVDMGRVEKAINFEAATGVPSTEATVQGQLTQLLSQFEGGATPPWAAGAMRAATATLAARGLAASSMAGQAVVQAAMESALPIAQADAATRASFEAQNLSNRQQTAMFAAQQRAAFLNLEFDQAFQTRVMNAAKISDIANMNFTAEQQIALENARLANSVDLANLSASNAKVIADAAAMTQVELTGLNNRQQAAIQNAQSFLQMDMTNLSNEQQVAIFKAQGNIQSLISDAAAVNAAAQFNAASENQTNQFYDNLISQVSMFNNEQQNAMERFNAEQANAIAQFNAAQKNARDQFNAQQQLVVAQANAAWDQAIATQENAAQNQANRDAAIAANNVTETAYNAMLQQERDMLDYTFRVADNQLTRENNYAIAEMQMQASVDQAKGSAVGSIVSTVATLALKKALG